LKYELVDIRRWTRLVREDGQDGHQKGFKMDMIGEILMLSFWGFTGVRRKVEIFKADKMDKMDIKYINIFCPC
jgi:hypothetical protein